MKRVLQIIHSEVADVSVVSKFFQKKHQSSTIFYKNLRFLLNKRPKGMPEDDCWLLDSQEITDLKNNEILIQTEYLSIDPYMRGKMNDTISYTPPLKIGEVMVGESVGRVIESKSKNIGLYGFNQ